MDRYLKDNEDMFYKRIQFDNRMNDIAERVLTYNHQLNPNPDEEGSGKAIDYQGYLNQVYPDRQYVHPPRQQIAYNPGRKNYSFGDRNQFDGINLKRILQIQNNIVNGQTSPQKISQIIGRNNDEEEVMIREEIDPDKAARDIYYEDEYKPRNQNLKGQRHNGHQTQYNSMPSLKLPPIHQNYPNYPNYPYEQQYQYPPFYTQPGYPEAYPPYPPVVPYVSTPPPPGPPPPMINEESEEEKAVKRAVQKQQEMINKLIQQISENQKEQDKYQKKIMKQELKEIQKNALQRNLEIQQQQLLSRFRQQIEQALEIANINSQQQITQAMAMIPMMIPPAPYYYNNNTALPSQPQYYANPVQPINDQGIVNDAKSLPGMNPMLNPKMANSLMNMNRHSGSLNNGSNLSQIGPNNNSSSNYYNNNVSMNQYLLSNQNQRGKKAPQNLNSSSLNRMIYGNLTNNSTSKPNYSNKVNNILKQVQ